MERQKLTNITGEVISGEWGDDDNLGTGIPVLRTTNFTNDGGINYSSVITRKIKRADLSMKYLQFGDIIIEKSGGSDKQPVGRVVYYDGPESTYLFNNFTGVLRIHDKNRWIPKYVFYSLYVNYLKGGTRAYENKTTGLHNLKTDLYVNSFAVTEMSIEEQEHVVVTLDKVYDLISLRKQQIVKLDELVKSQFIEMFGDLGVNDYAWPLQKLSEACAKPDDIKCGPFGTQLSQSEFVDNGIALWGIPQINSAFTRQPKDFLTTEKAKQLEAYSLIPGDIAMSRKGNVGMCALFPETYSAGIIHSDVLRIRVDSSKFNPVFLMYQLHISPVVETQIGMVSSGAVMAGINVSKLKNILIHVPPIDLQNQFAAFVQQLDKSKFEIQKSLEKLETLKKALMQKYFG